MGNASLEAPCLQWSWEVGAPGPLVEVIRDKQLLRCPITHGLAHTATWTFIYVFVSLFVWGIISVPNSFMAT